MSAAEALKAARAAGVQLGLDGEDLTLEAAVEPPVAVIDLLSCNKAGVVALLRTSINGWSAEDWQAFFDERAGIAEFDGGLRVEAEAQAFACCVAEWLNHHPVRSPPGRCLARGGGEQAHDALLPYGIEPTGHARLHSRCWPDLHAAREAEAVEALAKVGITAPDAILHEAHSTMSEVVRECDDTVVESTASAEPTVALADRSKALLLSGQAEVRVISDDLQSIVQTHKGKASAKSSGWRSRHFCRSREGLQLVLRRLLGRDGVPAHVAASISTLPKWHHLWLHSR